MMVFDDKFPDFLVEDLNGIWSKWNVPLPKAGKETVPAVLQRLLAAEKEQSGLPKEVKFGPVRSRVDRIMARHRTGTQHSLESRLIELYGNQQFIYYRMLQEEALKQAVEKQEPAPSAQVTFSDFYSLLLCYFLYSENIIKRSVCFRNLPPPPHCPSSTF